MTRSLLLRAAAVLLGGSALAWAVVPRAASQAVPEGATRYDADGRAVGEVAKPASPPNLVLIVLDTLRADALAGDGAEGAGSMPFLASIAGEGVSFAQASASAPWTLPSTTTLLTGLSPGAHGCTDPRSALSLPAAVTTFAEVLSRTYGYETVALHDTPWLSGPQALQGFDRASLGFALQGTADQVGPWARGRDRRRPFFLMLHTMEAHDPYGAGGHPYPMRPMRSSPDALARAVAAREPWQVTRAYFLDPAARNELPSVAGVESAAHTVITYTNDGWARERRQGLAAEIREGYLAGVRWVDGLLADAVGQLQKAGLLENTLLVVVGDHGEAFGEHGILGHGRQLYDELVRVPVVMRGPEPFRGGRVVTEGMGIIDVLPTFFDLAGLVPPGGIQGRSALPLVLGKSAGWPVVSEERIGRSNTGIEQEGLRVAVRTPRWKYVLTLMRTAGTLTEELYDLVADPLERHDLGGFSGAPASGCEEGFCHAVAEVRERIRTVVEQDRRLAGTAYGALLAPVGSLPATPCVVMR